MSAFVLLQRWMTGQAKGEPTSKEKGGKEKAVKTGGTKEEGEQYSIKSPYGYNGSFDEGEAGD